MLRNLFLLTGGFLPVPPTGAMPMDLAYFMIGDPHWNRLQPTASIAKPDYVTILFLSWVVFMLSGGILSPGGIF